MNSDSGGVREAEDVKGDIKNENRVMKAYRSKQMSSTSHAAQILLDKSLDVKVVKLRLNFAAKIGVTNQNMPS